MIGSIKTSKLKNDEKARTISKVEFVLKRTEEFEKVYKTFRGINAVKRKENA